MHDNNKLKTGSNDDALTLYSPITGNSVEGIKVLKRIVQWSFVISVENGHR